MQNFNLKAFDENYENSNSILSKYDNKLKEILENKKDVTFFNMAIENEYDYKELFFLDNKKYFNKEIVRIVDILKIIGDMRGNIIKKRKRFM